MLWYGDHGQLNGRADDLLREADRQRLLQLARGGRRKRARRARQLLWPQPRPSAA
jgi:hypothetical protein